MSPDQLFFTRNIRIPRQTFTTRILLPRSKPSAPSRAHHHRKHSHGHRSRQNATSTRSRRASILALHIEPLLKSRNSAADPFTSAQSNSRRCFQQLGTQRRQDHLVSLSNRKWNSSRYASSPFATYSRGN